MKPRNSKLWKKSCGELKLRTGRSLLVHHSDGFLFDDAGKRHLELREIPSTCHGETSYLNRFESCPFFMVITSVTTSLSEVHQICFHRDIARWTASSQVDVLSKSLQKGFFCSLYEHLQAANCASVWGGEGGAKVLMSTSAIIGCQRLSTIDHQARVAHASAEAQAGRVM